MQAVHARVHGRIDVQLGCFPPGTRYSAADPELMLWVHATLIEASLTVYQRLVRVLSTAEQERYQQMELVARLFGPPAAVNPCSLADFRDYFVAQLAGKAITITPPARELAAVIIEAPLPPPLLLLVPAHRRATAGLSPPC